MPILSRNVDQKSLETEFFIAICRHTGDKWQSKTLFLSIFDPHSSIFDRVFDCHLPDVYLVDFLNSSTVKFCMLFCHLIFFKIKY